MQSIIKLSDDDGPPCCRVCIYSRGLSGLDELSCKKKGIVSPDFICKKFSLDIMAKTARRRRTLNTDRFSPEDFSI